MTTAQISAGFVDPVHDAQNAFRRVLDALSRPGQRVSLGKSVKGVPLGPAMSHLLLTLTDDDTPVWWQPLEHSAADWLRFHTGAPLADAAGQAAFAVVLNAQAMPSLHAFACGTAESPEGSATLFIEVPSLDAGPMVDWRGPGIQEMQAVRIAGLPTDFWTQWQANNESFPLGVDIVFTCADVAIGLPRSTCVRPLEGH